MADNKVTANISVKYKKNDDSLFLKAEIDSRDESKNNGVTSNFPLVEPPRPVYVMTVTNDLTKIVNVHSTSGSLIVDENVTFDHEQILIFDFKDSATLDYPAKNGNITTQWYGITPGELSVGNDGISVILTPSSPQQELFGVCKVSYEVDAVIYKAVSGHTEQDPVTELVCVFVGGPDN